MAIYRHDVFMQWPTMRQRQDEEEEEGGGGGEGRRSLYLNRIVQYVVCLQISNLTI